MFATLELLLAPVSEDDVPNVRRRLDPDETAVSALSAADTALIAGVRRGEQDALEAIHTAHWRRLVRYAARFTGSVEAAQDLVQEVFLDVWIRRAQWAVHGSILSYLYAAVRGRALRVLRHERVTQRHARDVAGETFATGGRFGGESPEGDTETAQVLALVDQVLGTLPPRCREAFVLYREHGLELREVAGVMGTSVGTVKVQLRRAVAALREAVAPHMHG